MGGESGGAAAVEAEGEEAAAQAAAKATAVTSTAHGLGTLGFFAADLALPLTQQGVAGWSTARVQPVDSSSRRGAGMLCAAVPAESATATMEAGEEGRVQAVLGGWRRANGGAETMCSVKVSVSF